MSDPSENAIPGSWWPTSAAMIDHHRTRVELLDADDPDGIERADDHAIGTSLFVTLAIFGALAVFVRGSVNWAGPLLIVTWFALWLRSTRSGIWLSRTGIHAVSFPRRLEASWATVTFTTRRSASGDRVVVADDRGRTVALSMTQVASGVVFNRSQPWRRAALADLALHLDHIAQMLR